MNLHQLESFVHVAELGSFSKAALVLGIAQPALSRQVRALETDLRETLLVRTGRGVTLTDAGRRLYAHGVGILQAVAQARADMGASRDEPVGRVTIGLPPTIGRQLTLPLVDGFRRTLPRARLAIVEGLTAHIVEWITTGRVDVGLVYNPEPIEGLEIAPLLEEPLCIVARAIEAPPAWRKRGATGVPLNTLPAYPLIVPERAHAIRRLLETQAGLLGLKLDIAWEVSSIASIIDLVCAGYGHAVLTAGAVAASARADELVARTIADPRLSSVLCLAASATKRPTPLARRAREMLVGLVHRLPRPPADAGPAARRPRRPSHAVSG